MIPDLNNMSFRRCTISVTLLFCPVQSPARRVGIAMFMAQLTVTTVTVGMRLKPSPFPPIGMHRAFIDRERSRALHCSTRSKVFKCSQKISFTNSSHSKENEPCASNINSRASDCPSRWDQIVASLQQEYIHRWGWAGHFEAGYVCQWLVTTDGVQVSSESCDNLLGTDCAPDPIQVVSIVGESCWLTYPCNRIRLRWNTSLLHIPRAESSLSNERWCFPGSWLKLDSLEWVDLVASDSVRVW